MTKPPGAQGQIESLKDRLTAWEPALSRLYKLQVVHDLLIAGQIKPSEYPKAIELAKRWLGPNDTDPDDQSITALASQLGGSDGVLRQIEAEGRDLLMHIEQEKDDAIVRTLPERVQSRRYGRADVSEWEEKLPVFLSRAHNTRREREVRDAIEEAKRYLHLKLDFVGGGMAGLVSSPDDQDLDDEDRYRSILAGFIGLVPNVDERSQVTPEWRVLEKRQKEETSTATKAVAPIELQLPRVGTLRIEVASLQPPHKMVTLDFDTAQAAKKARTMLSRDFSIKVA